MDISPRCTSLAIVTVLCLSVFCHAEQADSNEPLPVTHVEIGCIGDTPETEFEKLVSFCMDRKGNLLACDADANMIRVISGEGKTLHEWDLDFAPHSVVAPSSNAIYAAGEGVVVKLDKKGRVTKRIESDGDNFPKGIPSGITSTGKDVFVALGTGWSLRSRSSVVRFDKNLKKPEVIMEDLRGCCRRLDLTSKKAKWFGKTRLFIAENSRFRVLSCDRKGEVLDKWGKKDRTNIEDFATCCNPMNICLGPKGELYTAESGLGRIKRYTPDGEFRGLVGYVGTERFTRAGRTAASCSNITVAVNKDASRIYVLDFKGNFIRVMAKADAKTTGK